MLNECSFRLAAGASCFGFSFIAQHTVMLLMRKAKITLLLLLVLLLCYSGSRLCDQEVEVTELVVSQSATGHDQWRSETINTSDHHRHPHLTRDDSRTPSLIIEYSAYKESDRGNKLSSRLTSIQTTNNRARDRTGVLVERYYSAWSPTITTLPCHSQCWTIKTSQVNSCKLSGHSS